MNVYSKAFLAIKRALVAFIAKVEGVVAKIFLGASPPDPLTFSHHCLAPSIQNTLRGPCVKWPQIAIFGTMFSQNDPTYAYGTSEWFMLYLQSCSIYFCHISMEKTHTLHWNTRSPNILYSWTWPSILFKDIVVRDLNYHLIRTKWRSLPETPSVASARFATQNSIHNEILLLGYR